MSAPGWCFISPRVPPERCGVGDYTWNLANEMATHGRVTIVCSTNDPLPTPTVSVHAISGWGPAGMLQLWRAVRASCPRWINLQYVPFLYHRTGINIWLPMFMLAVRVAGYQTIVTVHEPYLPLSRARWVVPGLLQRATLVALVSLATRVVVTADRWRRMLTTLCPWAAARIAWLPVGSNVPTQGLDRTGVREELGIPPEAVVLSAFSPLGSGKAPEWVWAAWERIRDDRCAFLLIIGRNRDEFAAEVPAAAADETARVIWTGFVSPRLVARYISAADVLLAPFSDGMSGRRTSVIAGLEGSVAVVTTSSGDTEQMFDEGVLMTPVANRDAFLNAAETLARDPSRRREVAERGQRLWQREFSWPVIANRLESWVSGNGCG